MSRASIGQMTASARTEITLATLRHPLGASSVTFGPDERNYRQSVKATAYNDLLSTLRDHYLFDDFSAIETWLSHHPDQYSALFSASSEIDLIFGSGRSKWLNILEDWEGSFSLCIEVEFGGSGEDASVLCRRFVSDWLVYQDRVIRQIIDLGVRFV